jgi:ubiquitin C-terminal hydrolase
MQESSNIMDTKIGLCGFKNIGNICYINSIIQFLHSKNLLVYLVQILEDKYFINLIIIIIMLGQYYLED